ncbi:MAG: hypothetical protein PHR16_15235 [Methylovulum sp.]|nr:hypothetical protein [Methylovulum sp.]
MDKHCLVGWADSFIVCPPFADKSGGQKSIAHPTWLKHCGQMALLFALMPLGKIFADKSD